MKPPVERFDGVPPPRLTPSLYLSEVANGDGARLTMPLHPGELLHPGSPVSTDDERLPIAWIGDCARPAPPPALPTIDDPAITCGDGARALPLPNPADATDAL